jgi:hypothetical protein
MAQAERAFSKTASRILRPYQLFYPERTAGLPEIAQRYFRHWIKPRTPQYSSAELAMSCSFLLGDEEKSQTYRIGARQVLRAPDQFV